MKILDAPRPGAGVRAFSVMRDTATPEQAYAGFNVCHYVDDTAEHVARCRQEFTEALGAPAVIPRQTHSLNVAVVTDPSVEFDNVDALVTRLSGVALCVNTADCLPVMMADATAGVVAIAHSGWRGTVGRIAVATLREMERLGARPERVSVAIGPSICADCFEVGPEVAQQFEQAGMSSSISIDENGRHHINLANAVAQSLVEAGVEPGSIHGPMACSRCNPHDWFSARRLGVKSGRTLSVIVKDGCR